MKAFISYSHRDENYLERLRVHLSVLKRERAITEWYDRDILAGDVLDDEIAGQLESSQLFVPLVSPDFLASNYCYEREMSKAIEMHKAGILRIVPVVVEPCDWQATPLQAFRAIPKDGTPVSDWTNPNSAFLDVVNELRRLVAASPGNVAPRAEASNYLPRKSSASNYRIKRDFDEVDRAEFRNESYQIIRDYFQSAIDESNAIDGIRGRFREISANSFTCTILNQLRQRGRAHITVHAVGNRSGIGEMSYSFTENAGAHTANGWFEIESDEYDLFLKQHGFSAMASDQRISQQSAAELLWEEFVSQAGITTR